MSEKKSFSLVFGVAGVALGAAVGALISYLQNQSKVFYKPEFIEDMSSVIKKMVRVAKDMRKTVVSKINGIWFEVTPNMTEGDAHARWRRLSVNQYKAVSGLD